MRGGHSVDASRTETIEAASPRPGASEVWGLALSSGAARGAAHAGALLALAEYGVDTEIVVGTSVGALIGGAWSAGLSAAKIAERIEAVTWSDFGSLRPSRRIALIETTALRANLHWIFQRRHVEDLPRRFAAVATDVRTRRAVLLDRGSAATAVEASVAVPGMFPPVRVGDRVLVDGALNSQLPVWAARRLGATRTIGVRLRVPTSRSGRSALQRAVLPPAEIIQPDIEIVIDTDGHSSWSSRDVPRLMALGYDAASRQLHACAQEMDLTSMRVAGVRR
ncbi:patatin-like phospholipase family protein [Streptomyces sp. GC420]|uniref:patatin-like phospholipase family protein n=1 Tax=Streptomyces sp. GC420 TaxID=2697568 RepID=UPI002443472B|nr:patatin-like phospholipase family protein [Streptomyces sp. GC420]